MDTSTNTATPDQAASDGMLGAGALSPEETSVAGGAGQSPALTSTDSTPKPGNQVPPSAPSTPAPAPTHMSTFDRILDAMGGRPKPTYQVNPQTGKLEAGPPAPMTTAQRLGMVVAAAMTGLAASEQKPGRKTGLSTLASGAGAVISQDQQNDDEAKAQAINDFKRKQEMQNQQSEQTMRQAQIFETNARTVNLTRQTENMEQDIRDKYVKSSSPLIESARTPADGSNAALLREHLTQAQLLQEHSQPGARHGTSNIYVPDGETPVLDPKTGAPVTNKDGSPRMELTFAEIDPNHQVTADSSELDEAASKGFPVPGYTPGSGATLKMPAGTYARITQFNQGVANFEGLTRSINSTLGLSGDKALNADDIIEKNPQVGLAFAKMMPYYDGQPSNFENALTQMQKDPKAAPYARTIVNAIGGNQVEQFAAKIAGQKKAEENQPTEDQKVITAGREAAQRLPYELAKVKAEQAVKDGDPAAAAQLLVHGDVAPSQLISARQPAFAQQAFTEAKKLDPKWNPEAAEGYFKVAGSASNVNFFGSAKSLTDQDGTLDQLQKAYEKLPNGRIPRFNKLSDWAAAASGSGATAEFAQTANGVADDYAKVMGGGTGSDTSRQQLLDSFARSSSPEQMAGAINAARRAVDSQMNSRIGTNPVMRRMYGDQLLIRVKDPQGGTHTFRTQDEADKFKKLAGIQ